MNLSSKITVLPTFSQPFPFTTLLLRTLTRVHFDLRIVSNYSNKPHCWRQYPLANIAPFTVVE